MLTVFSIFHSSVPYVKNPSSRGRLDPPPTTLFQPEKETRNRPFSTYFRTCKVKKPILGVVRKIFLDSPDFEPRGHKHRGLFNASTRLHSDRKICERATYASSTTVQGQGSTNSAVLCTTNHHALSSFVCRGSYFLPVWKVAYDFNDRKKFVLRFVYNSSSETISSRGSIKIYSKEF